MADVILLDTNLEEVKMGLVIRCGTLVFSFWLWQSFDTLAHLVYIWVSNIW